MLVIRLARHMITEDVQVFWAELQRGALDPLRVNSATRGGAGNGNRTPQSAREQNYQARSGQPEGSDLAAQADLTAFDR